MKDMEISRKMSKVLVIDDDAVQRLILRNPLEMDGHQVSEAENGIEALEKLDKDPDIRFLVTDLLMPEMDGFDLIAAVRRRELRYVYIIVMTSMDDRDSLLKALSLGADDYLTKPILPEELRLRLRGGIRLLKLEGQDELILSMAKLAEFRSEETGFHLERVHYYTRILARDFATHYPDHGLTLGIADEIAVVSPLHDIGKVAIPDRILHKQGGLEPDEWEIMKTHAGIGGKLIKEIYDRTGSPYLRFAYEIAMSHHERWDGGGYPHGLEQESIPLPARIMMLADVYDALTSERCYKKAFSHEKARSIILEEKGTHFDPKVVDGFLRQEDQWLTVRERFRD